MARVLIIDDQPEMAARAEAALRQRGHEAARATTAQAVSALAARRADVVVFRAPMSVPDAVMALAALRLRAAVDDDHDDGPPAVLVSTAPTAEQVARARRFGVRHVIDGRDYCPHALAAAVGSLATRETRPPL
jgi:CheY-like chemotaxis protein